MSEKKPLRTLFCFGIGQNFFNADTAEAKDVWCAFSEMWNGIAGIPGATIIGNLDDDQSMVGPSESWPWTTYLMADMPDYEAVVAACNLVRTTPVGDGTYKLWKYCRIQARIGRELVVPA